MTYILIVAWLSISGGGSSRSSAAMSVEFNSLQACQAASAEISRQGNVQTILCAAKGEKK